MKSSFEECNVMVDLKGFLTPKEVRQLIKGANFGEKARNQLLIKTLAYTGRRTSEVVGLKMLDDKGHVKTNKYGQTIISGGLKPSNIDSENNQILWSIVKKKKREMRWIPCIPELVKQLVDYIDIMGIKPYDRVFPITRQRVFGIVRRAGKNAGIEMVGDKMIHPHHLRHSYAILAIRNHVPIYKLKKLMAHSSIIVTEAYFKIAPEDLRDSAETIGEAFRKTVNEIINEERVNSTKKVGGISSRKKSKTKK